MAEEPFTTILIVDDDEDITTMLEEGIATMGNFRIIKALSGAEALLMVETEHPDLILLDIMMEGLDGTEVCRAIKSNRRTSHIPVIAVTVVQKEETEGTRMIMESGVDEHVSKPFAFSELEEIIMRHLKSQ